MLNSPDDIDIAILMIFYNFSDQYGKVDMVSAKEWANKKLGIIIKDNDFQLSQDHIDVLMDQEVIVNSRDMIKRITNTEEPLHYFQ
jgi:hypothetical protein